MCRSDPIRSEIARNQGNHRQGQRWRRRPKSRDSGPTAAGQPGAIHLHIQQCVDRIQSDLKSRVTKETTAKVNDGVGDPKAVIPGPRQQGNPGPSTSTSSNVSIGSKPDFETIYRRSTGGPPKKLPKLSPQKESTVRP